MTLALARVLLSASAMRTALLLPVLLAASAASAAPLYSVGVGPGLAKSLGNREGLAGGELRVQVLGLDGHVGLDAGALVLPNHWVEKRCADPSCTRQVVTDRATSVLLHADLALRLGAVRSGGLYALAGLGPMAGRDFGRDSPSGGGGSFGVHGLLGVGAAPWAAGRSGRLGLEGRLQGFLVPGGVGVVGTVVLAFDVG